MLRRNARGAALILLVLATWVGVHRIGLDRFAQAWDRAGDYGPTLGIVFALAVIDVVLSGTVWRRTYQWLGIALPFGTGLWIYVAGYAGLLVPAQLGRLIRPDAMSRLSQRPFSVCVRAEGAAVLLSLIAIGGLVVGLIAYALVPAAALPVAIGAVAVALYTVGRLADQLVPGWGFPTSFWWSRSAAALVGLQMVAWVAHGIGLRTVLVRALPDVSVWEPVLHASLGALGGAASGIPGGVGVTEWLLGGSLTLLHVPERQLVVSVAVFRAASQWIWLPIGWIALAALRRNVRPLHVEGLREPSAQGLST